MEEQAMKIANGFVVALVALATSPLMAQQADATARQSAQATAAGSQVSDSAQAGASAGDTASAGTEMRPVSGELVGKLDSKSAKAGDRVVVKTTETTKTADGTTIPKGSRLVGEVTDVQAHGSGSADSHVGIRFYRAELKGGQDLAIHSEIQSVSRPAGAVESASMEDEGSFGGVGGGARGGARVGGGGLAGGSRMAVSETTTGTASRAAASTSEHVGAATEGAGHAAEGAGHATVHAAGNATSNATAGKAHAGGSAAEGATAHATGVPGVMLRGRESASGSASGTLSASKKNVHLDSGTQMVLGVSKSQ
jgi:hypothetical protein